MNTNIKSGLLVALAALAADQASKLYLLFVYGLAGRGAVEVTSFFDLVLTWNKGISYGLFQQNSAFGRWALFGLMIVATIFLWVWLARAETRLTALAVGLIIGGAWGNAIDRLAYGAVMDFVHLHTPGYEFNWYVFNLSDTAIVAGVALLLYESLIGDRAAKAP